MTNKNFQKNDRDDLRKMARHMKEVADELEKLYPAKIIAAEGRFWKLNRMIKDLRAFEKPSSNKVAELSLADADKILACYREELEKTAQQEEIPETGVTAADFVEELTDDGVFYRKLRVSDLLKRGVHFATGVFSEAVDAEAEFLEIPYNGGNSPRAPYDGGDFFPETPCDDTDDSRDGFLWRNKHAYAPRITFIAGRNQSLSIGNCGEILDPAFPWPCPRAEKLLSFDACAELSAVLGRTWVATDPFGAETRYFELTDPSEAQMALIIGTWGGAKRSTRGLPAERGESEASSDGAFYFSKRSSKHGGEGVDYYLFNLSDNPKLKGALICDYLEGDAKIESDMFATFITKIKTIQAHNQKAEKLEIKLEELDQRFSELRQRVALNPIAKDPFMAEVPKLPESLSGLKLQVPLTYATRDDETFYRALQASEIEKEAERSLELAQMYVEAWEEFAPQYLALQPLAKEVNQWITVYDSCAYLYEPSPEPEQEGKITVDMYLFTKGNLLRCLRGLSNALESERESAAEYQKLKDKCGELQSENSGIGARDSENEQV